MAGLDLAGLEWPLIQPRRSDTPQRVARVEGRRVQKEVLRVLRVGAAWPERDGPQTAAHDRCDRRLWPGGRGQALQTLAEKPPDSMQIISSSGNSQNHGPI